MIKGVLETVYGLQLFSKHAIYRSWSSSQQLSLFCLKPDAHDSFLVLVLMISLIIQWSARK